MRRGLCARMRSAVRLRYEVSSASSITRNLCSFCSASTSPRSTFCFDVKMFVSGASASAGGAGHLCKACGCSAKPIAARPSANAARARNPAISHCLLYFSWDLKAAGKILFGPLLFLGRKRNQSLKDFAPGLLNYFPRISTVSVAFRID